MPTDARPGSIISAMASSSPTPAAASAVLESRPRSHLRVHAVNIYVRDQDKSLRFYVDQLEFSLAFDARLQTGRWVGVAPPDGTAVLTLIAPDPDSEEYKLIGRPTDVVFVAEDVIATYQEWSKRGVRFRHTPRLRRVKYDKQVSLDDPAVKSLLLGRETPVWGYVYTRFEDIDRNSFALVSFDEMTRALEEQRRAEAEKHEKERRAAHEMEIARQVQARLFPQTQPPLRTLEYAGICLQARQVGGDYYDFLDLGRDRMGLVLGDISGKGIAGALLMANLQANLRSQSAIAWDQTDKLLQSVNQLFCDNTPESAYATLFFAEYDDRQRRLRYANCGHPSAFVLRDQELIRLESTCTVLGLFKEWSCSIRECSLAPGDVLVLYTDGVTESFSAGEEEFGEERLAEVLLRYRQLPPKDLLAAVVQRIQEFSAPDQHDDITLIVARCRDSESHSD
jgi:serine phosphatase RsbU (regulator of sigma subunit)